MKDNDLDKLFNQKLNSSDIPFNEGAWEKAQQLLNKADDAAMDKLFANKFANRSIPFDKAAWYNAKKLIAVAGMGSQVPMYKTFAFYLSAATVAGLLYLGILASTNINNTTSPANNTIPTIVNETPTTTQPIINIDNTGHSNSESDVTITESISPATGFRDSESEVTTHTTLSSAQPNTLVGEQNNIALDKTSAIAIDDIEENNTPLLSENISNEDSFENSTVTEDATSFPSIVYLSIPEIQPIAINLPGPIYNSTPLIKPALSYNKHYIGIIGGPTATKYVNGGRYKNSFFIGAHYARHINSNWYMNANLIYQKTEAQNISKEFKDVSYGFGSSKKFTTVAAQKLHYLELPIYATYNLSNRHSVDAGVYVSYLINASSKITEVSEQSFESPKTNTTTGWGLNDGINSFDGGIILGYNYKINDKLQLGGRLNYGLTDITKNDFYQNNSFDNHFQLRLVLDYKLFNK